jgi:hypothetical protein|tara:strand:+ start:102 stop:920 length:819 start_codon:yes stop_codon:yes gene_type:complete
MAKKTTVKSKEDDDFGEVDMLLGNPVFISFTEDVLKMRRNMLVFSFIASEIVLSGATLDDTIAPLGISLENVSTENVYIGILCLLAYHVVHFIWNSLDTLQQWRIRLTGTWFSSPDDNWRMQGYEDTPSDMRRSSLYFWWSQTRDKFPDIKNAVESIRDETDKIKSHQITSSSNSDSTSELKTALPGLRNNIRSIESKLSDIHGKISSPRLEPALKNFDRWFWRFQKSQSLRWIILEFGGPAVFGLFSCGLLLWAIFCRSATEIGSVPLPPT